MLAMHAYLSRLYLTVCIVIIMFSQILFIAAESTRNNDEERERWRIKLRLVELISLKGFGYNPFRGFGPIGGELASESLVREDLAILKQLNVTNIRTYGVGLNQIIIPKIAYEFGISCATGVWIGTDDTANINEIEEGLLVTNISSMLIIGNEVLFKGDLAEAELIDYIKYAKNQTSVPVTTAEPWYTWLDHPNLANVSDILLIHIHPFWESPIFIDEPSGPKFLVNYTISIFNQVQEAFPNKEIVIAETGWPSAGRRDCTEETQRQYFEALIPLLHKNHIKCYAFEAFDEIWKKELWQGNQSYDVGPHWGVFNLDRTRKLSIRIFTEWFGGEYKITTVLPYTTSQVNQDASNTFDTQLSSTTKTSVYQSNGFEIFWVILVIQSIIYYKKRRIKS
ncbi:MAG: glycosyl hydrolase family 17 protein [Candidatus Hodarchaeota archaeon]